MLERDSDDQEKILSTDLKTLFAILWAKGSNGIYFKKIRSMTGWNIEKIVWLLAKLEENKFFSITNHEGTIVLSPKDSNGILMEELGYTQLPRRLLITLALVMLNEKEKAPTTLRLVSKLRGKKTAEKDLKDLENLGYLIIKELEVVTTGKARKMIQPEVLHQKLDQLMRERQQ